MQKKRLDLEPDCTATFARKISAGKLARRTITSSEAVIDFWNCVIVETRAVVSRKEVLGAIEKHDDLK